MKLKHEEYMDIAWGDHPDFELIDNSIVDHGRWCVRQWVICRHLLTEKFYGFGYDNAATEQQEVDNEDEITLQELRPVEKTIVVYEPIK